MNCKDYLENPMRFLGPKMGSRDDQTIVYWISNKDVQIVCGCFCGNLSEFEKRVKETYDDENKYRKEYDKYIETIKYLIEETVK